jgi:hypothetical protein
MLKKMPHIIFLVLVLAIILVGYIYFFQLSPTFVQKPVLEKPDTLSGEQATGGQITAEEIKFILNELDAYKLHSNPITGEKPIIEIKVDGRRFFFVVANNKIEETEQAEPDITLSCGSDTVKNIISREDVSSGILDLFSGGDIVIEINKDEKNLALKGYKVIYDKIYPQTNEITGEVIMRLNPLHFLRGINLSVLVFISLIIGLIIEKEI